MKINKLLILSLSLFGTILIEAAPPVGKGYKLIYEENFDGKQLDETMWFYRVGRRTGGGYMNGVNRKENVEIKNGKLYIYARHENIDGQMENTGGGIQTLKNFGYGYFETLSKPIMKGRGVHSSFWQAGSSRANNNVFEIDSYEIDSKSYMGCNNLYYQLRRTKEERTPWPYRCHIPFTVDDKGFFLDAFEVTPDGIHFYDNGKQVAYCEWKELNAQQMIWLTALNGCGPVDTDLLPDATEFEYFRYYAKDYPGVTILPNGNFEYNQDYANVHTPLCWVVEKEDTPNVQLIKGNAPRDEYYLRLGQEQNNYTVHVRQPIEMICDGEYQLRGKVRCDKGARFTIRAEGKGGRFEQTVSGNQWNEVSIPNVMVVGNEVMITLYAEGNAGSMVEVDDVEFFKPMPKGDKRTESAPYRIPLDPIWQLGMKYPEVFDGGEKFFFFDRIVGLGDAITVKMTVTAGEMANTIPVARMPKKGNGGWSVQLSESGDVIFCIGSEADHTAIIAPKAYRAGVPCAIRCTFDNGTASIYINGKRVTEQKNIPHNTRETATPGRVGKTNTAFEVVSDVIVDMGKSAKENNAVRIFKGKLEKLQIYNRVAK